MDKDRAELKVAVYLRHRTYVAGLGMVAFCPWCKQVIVDEYDLHEYLVKRSAVPRDKQNLIMVSENCVPWHHACHMEYGQTKGAACKSLWAAARAISPHAIGKWYVSLWKEHDLEIPKGMLFPPELVSPSSGLHFFNKGCDFLHIPRDGANWTISPGGDIRGLAILEWQGRKLPVRKPPVKWGNYNFSALVDAVDAGYWLDYLEGVLDCGGPGITIPPAA